MQATFTLHFVYIYFFDLSNYFILTFKSSLKLFYSYLFFIVDQLWHSQELKFPAFSITTTNIPLSHGSEFTTPTCNDCTCTCISHQSPDS